jgi:PD-(D/E)XK nuclease superfamily
MVHSETHINGIWFPSVTTILNVKPKPWLDKWKERWGILAIRKMKIAAAVGDEFHKSVERCLNGVYNINTPSIDGKEMPSLIPRVEKMMDSWIGWANSVKGVVSGTELKVLSKKYGYSGTLDAVGTLEGVTCVYDWKTSGKIYDDMQLQLAAYAQAYNEQEKANVKQGLIVCVSKDKPHFKVTVKLFKLGKRPLNKFLKLKKEFDRRVLNAEINVPEETGC